MLLIHRRQIRLLIANKNFYHTLMSLDENITEIIKIYEEEYQFLINHSRCIILLSRLDDNGKKQKINATKERACRKMEEKLSIRYLRLRYFIANVE